MRAEEFSMDNLVGILHNVGLTYGLEINWHKNVAYCCNGGTPPEWVEKYHLKWAQMEIFQIYLASLHLRLPNVDQFLLIMVNAKLKYWNFTHLSLACRTLIVNQMRMSSLWYFSAVWVGFKKML